MADPHIPPEDLTFVDKEYIAKTTVLTLVKAEGDDGKHYYAYAAVPANALQKLIRVQRSGKPYDLRDYGTILEAGLGEPSADAEQRMEEKYGFFHEKMIVLSDDSDHTS